MAYSGGKDSLITLDLAVRHYGADRVEALFMYFLPGLDYSQVVCAAAADRWGVRVHQVQHWVVSELLRDGVFCDERPDCPDVRIKDVEAAMRAQTGKRWIAYGYRAHESLERRAMLSREFQGCGVDPVRGALAPIATWGPRQVRHYIRQHAIALAMAALGEFRGVSLSPASLHWIRRHFPRDYARILQVFPYAHAQADRWPAINAASRARVRVSRDPSAADH